MHRAHQRRQRRRAAHPRHRCPRRRRALRRRDARAPRAAGSRAPGSSCSHQSARKARHGGVRRRGQGIRGVRPTWQAPAISAVDAAARTLRMCARCTHHTVESSSPTARTRRRFMAAPSRHTSCSLQHWCHDTQDAHKVRAPHVWYASNQGQQSTWSLVAQSLQRHAATTHNQRIARRPTHHSMEIGCLDGTGTTSACRDVDLVASRQGMPSTVCLVTETHSTRVDMSAATTSRHTHASSSRAAPATLASAAIADAAARCATSAASAAAVADTCMPAWNGRASSAALGQRRHGGLAAIALRWRSRHSLTEAQRVAPRYTCSGDEHTHTERRGGRCAQLSLWEGRA